MKRVELGETGMMVSRVVFGGIPVGSAQVEEEEAVEVIKHCLDLGINFLDTAHAYDRGEERIGKAIAGRRDEIYLATKGDAREGRWLKDQLELSLRRLNVEYIDLYQLHGVSSKRSLGQVLAPNGPLEMAERARDEGKIKHIGITSHHLGIAKEALQTGRFETVMFPFNFLTVAQGEELSEFANEEGIGFIGMKPLGGGSARGLFTAPGEVELAFRFLNGYPTVIPVVGIGKKEEIDQILAIVAQGTKLTPEDEGALEQVIVELSPWYCPACFYCLPVCPEEIIAAGPVDLALQRIRQTMTTEQILEEWNATQVEKAKGCSKCGKCEEACPYRLPVMRLIEQGIAFFKEVKAATKTN